jgi:PAS domain S-box-containing protein
MSQPLGVPIIADSGDEARLSEEQPKAARTQKRKPAEGILKQSEQEFHRVFEDGPLGMAMTSPKDGRFLKANAVFCQMLGYTEAELKRLTFLDVTHPDHRKADLEAVQKLWAGQIPHVKTEKRYLRKNGETLWGALTVSLIFNAAGKPIYALAMIEDIAERKQAEAALRESEERFRALVETAPEAIFIQIQGHFAYANAAGLRLFGAASPEALLGQPVIERFDPHFRAVIRDRIRLLTEEHQQVPEMEETFLKLDGSAVPVLVSAVPFAYQNEHGALVFARDITERKLAEEQLRKLATAVAQSPVSIVITNATGAIEYVNPKFTQVTGYALGEVLGKNPRILKSGETSAEEYRQMWETITAGKEWRGEFHNKRKDGTLYWEMASISPLRNPAGEITHFISVKEDTTERKQLESKFLRAQRLEGIGSLASGIAHDLNNILAPIAMCASLLRVETGKAERRHLLATIEVSSERAVGVVRQLLSVGHQQEGKKAVLQPKHMILEMAQMVRETFPRSIQVCTDCPADLWPVKSNATQIHQVLLNLCVNARDAMPTGGRLTLRAENVVVDEHYASMHTEASAGPYVRIQVADTGTGISEAVRERIYDPFFTTKGPEIGTGLGLTTVLGIVKNHQGFMTFTSEPGKGTVFEVSLPAVPNAETPQAADLAAPSARRGHGEMVLVVDDESAVRQAVERTLLRYGYQPLLAEDGVDALAKFSAHKEEIRAVLTDLMMPVMDGAMLCRALRKLSPKTPLIVSTGMMLGEAAQSMMKSVEALEIKHLLPKPHTAEVLVKTLQEALGQPGAS